VKTVLALFKGMDGYFIANLLILDYDGHPYLYLLGRHETVRYQPGALLEFNQQYNPGGRISRMHNLVLYGIAMDCAFAAAFGPFVVK
jgi:hypothetical protein